MINIVEEYVYERESCDCCDGWYDLHLHLYVDGIYHGDFTDALDLMRHLSGLGKEFKYEEAELPDYD